MTRPALAVALLALATASGCGTILRGSQQTIHVESLPSGAEIREVRSGQKWVTPADLTLPRAHDHALTAVMTGYQSQEILIDHDASAAMYFANLSTLGLGSIVDAITGGLFVLSPQQVTVVLDPLPPLAPAPDPPLL